uniref:Uncharacterized protein LOC113791681 n=1 Tax=Dermatophagoides pteronyssinus TaxID=6956 RepID=A0A6P6XV41_DERPT|nr:uncharacterized protein LOC113791681 [Dermatophagoides pteronyssinus]
MVEPSDSSLAFFQKASPKQWRFVYELRRDAIKLKADQRSFKKGGPEEFIKLDTWFREKLPQMIHSRKDPHVLYEELVQIAKWRLMMGKYRPKMLDLVRINTETSVVNITRKAFKKMHHQKNLQQAITQLVNLKGIGPSTASAVLAAAYPEQAPFMSDEGMLSTPGVEATDSTIAEFNNYSEQLRNKTESLRQSDPDYKWTPHKVDQVLWIYYLIKDSNPTLLDSMPRGDDESINTDNNVSQLSDAADDNANVMAPTTTSIIGADGDESSSQDVLLNHNHNESSLNGSLEDSESASVPYSEEDLSSQGAASCSVDSTAATIGSDVSAVCTMPSSLGSPPSNIIASITSTPIIIGSQPITNGVNGNSNANGGVINTNNNQTTTSNTSSSGIGEEDSNLSADDHHQQRMISLTSNIEMNQQPRMLTPSEENSVDNSVGDDEVSLDEAPPMKKQKTGLDLVATAEPTGAEA